VSETKLPEGWLMDTLERCRAEVATWPDWKKIAYRVMEDPSRGVPVPPMEDPTVKKSFKDLAATCAKRIMADYPDAKELDVIRMLGDYGHAHMVAVEVCGEIFNKCFDE